MFQIQLQIPEGNGSIYGIRHSADSGSVEKKTHHFLVTFDKIPFSYFYSFYLKTWYRIISVALFTRSSAL